MAQVLDKVMNQVKERVEHQRPSMKADLIKSFTLAANISKGRNMAELAEALPEPCPYTKAKKAREKAAKGIEIVNRYLSRYYPSYQDPKTGPIAAKDYIGRYGGQIPEWHELHKEKEDLLRLYYEHDLILSQEVPCYCCSYCVLKYDFKPISTEDQFRTIKDVHEWQKKAAVEKNLYQERKTGFEQLRELAEAKLEVLKRFTVPDEKETSNGTRGTRSIVPAGFWQPGIWLRSLAGAETS